jgi:hypothetical protein
VMSLYCPKCAAKEPGSVVLLPRSVKMCPYCKSTDLKPALPYLEKLSAEQRSKGSEV